MTTLINILIAALISMCNTLTGYDMKTEHADEKTASPTQNTSEYIPADCDNCVSFNVKNCIVLKL